MELPLRHVFVAGANGLLAEEDTVIVKRGCESLIRASVEVGGGIVLLRWIADPVEMSLVFFVAVTHRQIVAYYDDCRYFALLRQSQLVFLQRAVARDDVGVDLVGYDDAWKGQVEIRCAIVFVLNNNFVLVHGLLERGQAEFVEDTGLECSLQHRDGLDALKPFRQVGKQAERIRPERGRESLMGHCKARQSALLQDRDEVRGVLPPQFHNSRSVSR